MNQTCEHCRFWKRAGYTGVGRSPFDATSHGECRKSAPVTDARVLLDTLFLERAAARWGLTNNNDFCGDFEPKEQPNGN